MVYTGVGLHFMTHIYPHQCLLWLSAVNQLHRRWRTPLATSSAAVESAWRTSPGVRGQRSLPTATDLHTYDPGTPPLVPSVTWPEDGVMWPCGAYCDETSSLSSNSHLFLTCLSLCPFRLLYFQWSYESIYVASWIDVLINTVTNCIWYHNIMELFSYISCGLFSPFALSLKLTLSCIIWMYI